MHSKSSLLFWWNSICISTWIIEFSSKPFVRSWLINCEQESWFSEEYNSKNLYKRLTLLSVLWNIVLTVAVVAGVDAAFKGLHLRKLGQHLSKGAAALVSLGAWAFADAVVSLRKLQRQIPEWLYCVRLVLTGQTRHLKKYAARREE